ncbi:MAG: helix-turn-helix domain-containing protein [Acidobacteriota bacterium]|nr:helix-turn-helix domain-containing protein [Acidobacteriota bacterium]
MEARQLVHDRSETLGARLRRQREAQDVALTLIADRTKIKLSLLEALERDDVSHWPTGIFRRAYIRDYAQAIGLPPEDVLREFLAVHPDPDDACPAEADTAPAAPGEPGRVVATSRLRQAIDAALAALARLRRRLMQDGTGPPPLAPQEPPRAAVPAVCPELLAAAELCSSLARVARLADAAPLLHDAAAILDAPGLIVWGWDPAVTELTPVLSYGYPEELLGRMSHVRLDAANATAVAFRSGRPSAVCGGDRGRSALVLPLMTASGCAGALAVEFRNGDPPSPSSRAVAALLAAQLARLADAPAPQRADGARRRRGFKTVRGRPSGGPHDVREVTRGD